jgi:hypothetical protein
MYQLHTQGERAFSFTIAYLQLRRHNSKADNYSAGQIFLAFMSDLFKELSVA